MTQVTLEGGQKLINVHQSYQCGTRPCPIHRMSNHSMRSFPQRFCTDNGLMERICEHGVGHPDPDALAFFEERGIKSMDVHSCDGCCGNLI